MEHIWSPWRYQFVSSVDRLTGCIFCELVAENADEKNNVVHRDSFNYIVLNLFPYTSGHLMIVPYRHQASIAELDEKTTTQMMELAKRSLQALSIEYHPDGFNVGFNLGKSAGAGVADHVHLHVVPRWSGDANFMSVIGETRVLPEDLASTYKKIKKHFAG